MFLVLFSCGNNETVIDNSQTGLSIEQKEMIKKMEDASKIILQMVTNDEVNSELNCLIQHQMYGDDYIPFKDLFFPNKNDKLKSSVVGETAFAKAFNDISNLKSQGLEVLKDYLVENNLAIYIPYPLSDYPEERRIPTITFHPLLNDSVNIGFEPIIKNLELISYNEVAVCENYTLEHPVYIVVPISRLDTSYGNEETIGYFSDNQDVKLKSKNSYTGYEIRIKKACCKVHYDNIFNGGSEVYFGNARAGFDGGHVSTFPDGFPYRFSRPDIRNDRIVDINTLFLADWSVDNTQLVMFVFEDDERGTQEVSGQAKFTHKQAQVSSLGLDDVITYKVDNSGTYETAVGFKQTVNTQDAVIFQNGYPRNWFFATNSDRSAEWGDFDEDDNVVWRGAKDQVEWTMTVAERSY